MLGKKNNKILIGLGYLVYVFVITWPLIQHLGKRTVRLWDEALFALRALHFNETGNILLNFNQFEYLPFHLNTKPIFGTFFQSLSFNFFGYNEIALRLPIVLFSLLTVAGFIWFGKRILKNQWVGLLSGLILITSIGYMMVHVGRGGEQDAILASMMSLSLLFFYAYTENLDSKIRLRYILLCSFTTVFAVLTKLIVGFFFLPGIFLYLILRKKLKNVITDKYFLISAILGLSLIGLYYFAVESANPGYFQRLWEYELVGRYTRVIETDSLSWNYYIQRLIEGKFQPWFVFMALSIFWINKKWTANFRNIKLLLLASLSFYLIIISISKTKKFWYDAPTYPIMSILAAIGLYELFKFLKAKKIFSKMHQQRILVLFGITLFAIPYSLILKDHYWPKNNYKADKYGYMLRKMEVQNPEIKEFSIAIPDFGASAVFYQNAYNLEKGYNISLSRDYNFANGKYVTACLNDALNPIYEKYETKQISNFDECVLLEILGKR